MFKRKRKLFNSDIDISNLGDTGRESFKNYQESSIRNNELIRTNQLVFWLAILLVILVLFLRSFYLQIVKGEHYADIAENNRIRSTVTKAPRGLIESSDGKILAQNIPSSNVVFLPILLPDDQGEKEKLAQKLAEVLKENEDEIKERIFSAPAKSKERYLLKEGVDHNTSLVILERSDLFPGIEIENASRRYYPYGDALAHLLGYDGKITQEELKKNLEYLMTDRTGKQGLEYSYEKNLKGIHGRHNFEVDSVGNIKNDLGKLDPVSGDRLITHLDAGLQKKTAEVLRKILEENKEATGAVAVILDPRTGGVRSLVSVPSFDNNVFSRGVTTVEYQELINDPRKPLFNKAIVGEYPPGSTFKPLVAVAALEEGIISEHTRIDCHGLISIGQWKFPDWKTHGNIEIKEAIAESCNVFFYALGGGWQNIPGLGIGRIGRYATMFGLGKITGIDVPGEKSGFMPDNNWKFKRFGEKWYVGDDYHAAIGQGYVLATPLQMALMTASIANGGTVFQPTIVDRIIFPDGREKKIEPEVMSGDFVSSNSIRVVKEGMKQTVYGPEGSARQLADLEVETAGKTGTAQFGADKDLHSWYVSFAPYENSELAMVVLIEGGGEGYEWAVPATKEIYKWYFDEERGRKTEDLEDKNKNDK